MKSLLNWRRRPKPAVRDASDWPNALPRLRDGIDRLFDRLIETAPLARWGNGDLAELADWATDQGFAFAPSVDVSENDTHVVVKAEIPGVDPKDLELALEHEVLVISGRKEERSEKKDETSVRTERRFGSFRRDVPLPWPVDPDEVRATYEQGVLTVELKKAATARSRRIEIKRP